MYIMDCERDLMADKEQTLLEHFEDLRIRLLIVLVVFVVSFIGCYCFSSQIFGFLIAPLNDVMKGQDESTNRMIYTKLTEGFVTTIKTASFGALVISIPMFLLVLWGYLAPGLYKSEKRVLLPYFIATPSLFVVGGAFAYYFIIPLAWKFLLSFQGQAMAGSMPVQLEASVGEYLSLITSLMLVFGSAFQLPVIMSLLIRANLVSIESLIKFRKYAIVLAFLMAAILTPPDIVSQIGLAVPMLLLYELSILLNRGAKSQMSKTCKN